MAEQVTVMARIHAGMESEVRAIIAKNLEPTRAENGCVFYRLFETKQSGLFYFFELWESAADLEAHSKSSHLAISHEALKDKLQEPTEVSLVTEVL
jgi:quinol monooxygenase YgiN